MKPLIPLLAFLLFILTAWASDDLDHPARANTGGTEALAEHWPGFRGPTGCGLTTEKNLPLEWNAKTGKNVRWSVAADGQGTASPIVWGNRVFVVNVAPADHAEQPLHQISCFQAQDGKRLWKTLVEPGPFQRGGLKGGRGSGYANATPCTDGERVYAVFGSSVLVAVDFSGKQVWRYELKPFNYSFEMATSPVLHQDLVILFCGLTREPRLLALKKQTGEVVYDHQLKDTGYCHSTPLLARVNGKPQLLVAASSKEAADNALQSFDPATGKRLWWAAGVAATATPVMAHGCVYFDSGRGGLASLVEVNGTGDVTATHLKWTTQVAESLGSPVVVGQHIYRLHNNGLLVCRGFQTGDVVYQQRVLAGSAWASPIVDPQGRIYLATAGRSAVVQAGEKFQLLATNDLGDPGHASPAAANSCLYLLGERNLWCIGTTVSK